MTLLSLLFPVLTSIQTLFFYLLLRCFFPLRNHILWNLPGFAGCFGAVTTVIFPNDPTNLCFLFVGLTITVFLCFQGTFMGKFSAVLIFFPIIVSINYIALDLCGYLYNLLPQIPLWETLTYQLNLALRGLFWIILYFFFRRWLPQVRSALTFRLWLITDASALTAFVGIISVINLVPDTKSWLSWPSCIACLVTDLGCLYLTWYLSNSVKTQAKVQSLKYQEEYYRELEKNQQAVRRIYHDMNHHLSVIKALLYDGQYEKANRYLDDLTEFSTIQNRCFCESSILNAVLNAKYNQAEELEVKPVFHIDLNGFTGLDDLSLCSLFSNTLDNALEALAQIKEPSRRKLSVKARFKDNYFSYEIENTLEGPIREKNGILLSTKPDRKNHGFGIANVKRIVAQYQGTLDYSYTDDTFTLLIFIRL